MRVMIAVDWLENSPVLLGVIMKQPWWGNTEFLIVSVLPLAEGRKEDLPPQFKNESELNQSTAVNVLSKMVAQLKRTVPYCQVGSRLEYGDVCDQLVEAAILWGADLIVVGSHKRKKLREWVLGDVATAVLQRAPCSVEIVKIPKTESADVAKSMVGSEECPSFSH